MRLRDLQDQLNLINFNSSLLSQATPGVLSNLNRFKEVISEIKGIGLLADKIQAFEATEIYSTPQDALQLNQKNAMDIERKGNAILASVIALKDIFIEFIPPLSDNSLSIKLPSTNDFTALHKNLKGMEQAFNLLIVNDEIGGCTQVENWEHGSYWINITVGSILAVTLVGSSVWAAAVISKKFTENNILEQQVGLLELKKDSLADLLDKQKMATDLIIEAETRAVFDSNFTNLEDNEQYERVKKSIVMFAELIQKGAEIHPSLLAPEKAENLFPDFSNLELITSKIKQIEYKK